MVRAWAVVLLGSLLLAACSASPAAPALSQRATPDALAVTVTASGAVTGSAAGSTAGSATATASTAATASATATADAGPPLHLPMPAHVRGIYLTGWTAGSRTALDRLIHYVLSNHLNTMVIDIKDNDGRLSFPLPGTEAETMGADGHKVPHVRAVLKELHADHIYVIGRIVTFADPWLARKHPGWAIHNPNGSVWLDRHGQPWIDPKSQAVWKYNIQIGIAAAKLGFDQIQYDYIRLPGSRIVGYNVHNTAADREKPVDAFLQEAHRQVEAAAHVPVSGDVFAIDAVAVSPEDGFIGQDYVQAAHRLDFISPMAYPSLYAPGEFGISNPNARPYDTLWETMASAEARTADLPIDRIQPWIQDYDLWMPPHYGPAQVDAEIEALAAAGIRSFMMWNAGNVYTQGIDFSLADTTPLAVPSPVWLPAPYELIRSGVKVLLPATVPAAGAGNGYSITAASSRTGYAADLWATAGGPLPTNGSGIAAGTLLLAVGGAHDAAGLGSLPAVGGTGTGSASPTASASGTASGTGATTARATGSGATGTASGAGSASGTATGTASGGATGTATATGGQSTSIATGTANGTPTGTAAATGGQAAGTPVPLGGGIAATATPAAGGVQLVWQAGGEAFRIWAADLATALAAAKSMRALPMVEGR